MQATAEWRQAGGTRCLLLRFDGPFSLEDAQGSVRRVRSMIDGVDGMVTVVCDCTDLAGYDSGAREALQVFVREIKPRIAAAHLVSPNAALRGGAALIGIVAGIKISTWANLDEFQRQA